LAIRRCDSVGLVHYNSCDKHYVARRIPPIEARMSGDVCSPEKYLRYQMEVLIFPPERQRPALWSDILGTSQCSEIGTGVCRMPNVLLKLEAEALNDMAKRKKRSDGVPARHSTVEPSLVMSAEDHKLASFWPRSLSEWAQVIGVVLPILVAICGATLYLGSLLVDKHIQAALNPIQGDVNQINANMSEIKGELRGLEGKVGSINLKQLSGTPGDPRSIRESQDVLRAARLNNVRFDSDTIANAGQRFIGATKGNPDAWKTVLEFLNYRSYLNSVTVPLGPQEPLSASITAHYKFSKNNVPEVRSMRAIGTSKPGHAAELGNLPQVNLNEGLPVGPSLLVLDAPTVILDNLYAKNIIIIHSHIIYRGGPLALDNVYFLNCTFEIERQPRGQELAGKILAGTVTNFSS
jgi:hypothetical protein